MDWIYLDNNATTPPAPQAVQAMLPYLTDLYANPSSVHHLGGQVRGAIDKCRGELADLLGADPGELVFTSGGTESDNLAIRGLLAARRLRTRLVISAVEHAAVWDLADALEQDGVEVVRIRVGSGGQLDLDQLADAIDADRTAAVSIMHANNETGVIFPIEAIGQLCRQRAVPFHCDAVQTAFKLPLDLAALPVDALSLSAHKFHGPKGVGLLYLRRGTPFRSWLAGVQEHHRRGGTENVAGIVGMAEAAKQMRIADCGLRIEQPADRKLHPAPSSNLQSEIRNPKSEMESVRALRDRLEQGILSSIPDTVVNGAEPRLVHTSNISFVGCQSEALVVTLSEQRIAASAGSACASGSMEPSQVLRAMGLPPRLAQGAIRWSLSRYTRPAEIARVLEVLPPVVERLRAIRA